MKISEHFGTNHTHNYCIYIPAIFCVEWVGTHSSYLEMLNKLQKTNASFRFKETSASFNGSHQEY